MLITYMYLVSIINDLTGYRNIMWEIIYKTGLAVVAIVAGANIGFMAFLGVIAVIGMLLAEGS